MNRKILTSLGIIALLAALIVIKNWNCGPGVPEPGKWDGSPDEITVKAEGYSLKLLNRDGRWFINDENYPADPDAVADFEKRIAGIKLLDLISEKGYFDKYDLTAEKGVEVIVSGKGKPLRKILVGKSGSTSNHVYVRIDDSKEVYLASGINAAEVKPETDTLRDKKIFDLTRDSVVSFSIRYAGREYRFIKAAAGGKEEKAGGEAGKAPAGEPARWICSGFESLELDGARISGIVNSFAPLRAATFAEKPDKGSELCTVKVNTAEKEYLFTVYSKKDKDLYTASSPESPYLFTLGGWQAEKYFIKNIRDLEKKK